MRLPVPLSGEEHDGLAPAGGVMPGRCRVGPWARGSGLRRLAAEGAEFDGNLDVEQGDVLGLQSCELALAFVFAERQADLHGLVGQLEEVGRMEAPAMPEAFDAGH